MPDNETITIYKDEYERLRKNTTLLWSLRACGVDNWQGYDDAMSLYYETYPNKD